MTTRTTLTCDSCGRVQSAGNTDRWAVLTVTANGRPVSSDICPSCTARVRGWQNPIVAGTGGTPVREYAKHPAHGGEGAKRLPRSA